MQFSHSRIECFNSCKFKYKLNYIDELTTIPNTDANNPLVLGTAIHEGIEKGLEEGIKAYCDSFPILTDAHINEIIKLEYWIPRVREILPFGMHELEISDANFIGYADLLVPVDESNTFDLYDFKYTSNQKSYMESGQLHEYKYFIEKTHPGWHIRNMYFVFIPKISIRQKKTETILSFRERLKSELEKETVQIAPVQYNPHKVIEFALSTKEALETLDFPKEKNYLCGWCQYKEYCESEVAYMLLPKNERRNVESISKKVVWLYGAPFSGKTFLANKFPDPIMLNTDGNIKFVDAPYISIKDDVKVEGRQVKRTFAWQVLKDVIAELEKKENTFKTIIVDLLEDCYEHCRIYMYDKLNIEHESDDSFSAWDKIRTEFLSTLKRLMNLDYENIILISHEDRSKDITRRSGDKITSIKPNLQDKVSNKVAGMVDIVARVVAEGEERTLSFKTNEVIFGGGRLTVSKKEIPLDYDAFMEVYEEANKKVVATVKTTKRVKEPVETPPTLKEEVEPEEVKEVAAETVDSASPEVQEAEPVKPTRTRRTRTQG